MFRQTVAITLLISLQVIVSASSRDDEDRVVGGRSVTINELPHQISIQKGAEFVCGASLISLRAALTAAHCVNKLTWQDIPNLKIVAGTTNYAVGGQRIPVATFAMHPWYNSSNQIWDVAVVTMKRPVVPSKSVKPIVMATKAPQDGTLVVVSGWGYKQNNVPILSTDLQAGELNFMSRSSCSTYPNMYVSSIITDSMVCAGAEGINSCKGDSGGPLMDVDANQLVGVVSWGYDCAVPSYPTVYTNVAVVKPWIDSALENLSYV